MYVRRVHVPGHPGRGQGDRKKGKEEEMKRNRQTETDRATGTWVQVPGCTVVCGRAVEDE